MNDENSIFYHYKKLINLRKNEELMVIGKYEDIDLENEKVYAYRRVGDNGELVIISNFYENPVEFNVKGLNLNNAEVLLSNYKTEPEISEEKIFLKPYEAVIFKKISE